MLVLAPPPLVALPMSDELKSIAEFDTGTVNELRQPVEPSLGYYLYAPDNSTLDTPVLVVVHGISRDAKEQIELFRDYADRNGVVLIAPRYTENNYPDFQRLGRRGRGQRADIALIKLLDSLPYRSVRDGVFLFGYSGGGQFTHRFSMAHPEKVKAAIVAAPGWYTMPNTKISYPYGLRIGGSLPGVRFQPDRFIHVPTLVVVGEQDTLRDDNLRKSKSLDRRQGQNRV